jgi:PD-(D/E)XK endonuclease
MFVRAEMYGAVVDTIQKGNAAEAAVMNRLVSAGIGVLIPFGGGLSFDLGAVIPPEGDVVRIQVKCGRMRDGCVRFNTCSTDHGMGRQSYEGRADLIAVYVAESERIFMLPVSACPAYLGMLRLCPPRNNQRRGIRFAEDHSFETWLSELPRAIPRSEDADRPHLRHPHAEGEPEAA